MLISLFPPVAQALTIVTLEMLCFTPVNLGNFRKFSAFDIILLSCLQLKSYFPVVTNIFLLLEFYVQPSKEIKPNVDAANS